MNNNGMLATVLHGNMVANNLQKDRFQPRSIKPLTIPSTSSEIHCMMGIYHAPQDPVCTCRLLVSLRTATNRGAVMYPNQKLMKINFYEGAVWQENLAD